MDSGLKIKPSGILSFEQTFSANFAELTRVLHELPNCLHQYSEQVYPISLCVDELITNVIRYQNNAVSECQIRLAIYLNNSQIQLLLTDNAKPFNPFLEVAKPNIQLDLHHRQIGGLGVYLVKTLMDEYFYAYEAQQNKILLVKRIV